MDDCPKGLNTQTQRDLLIHQRANGNFIKLKPGIYISGQRGQKGKAPSHQEQWERMTGASGRISCWRQAWQAYRAAAGTLVTGGITITKESQVLSKLYPQASAEQRGQGARGQTALQIAMKKREKDLGTYNTPLVPIH